MNVSLAPLLNDLASGEVGSGAPADESLLAVARSTVEEVIRRHGALKLRVRGPGGDRDEELESRGLDQAEGFLSSVELALSTMRGLPPSDDAEQRELWELQDAIREMRTPASRPLDWSGAFAFEKELERTSKLAAELAKGRLMRIEQHATASNRASLMLEAGNSDAAALGHFIKQARLECGITVTAFKEAIDKSDGYIRMLERGAKVASAETYEQIFRTLGLRVARDGSTLIVRDNEGRQVDIQLVAATPKKVLVQQARERAQATGRSSQPDILVEHADGTGYTAIEVKSYRRPPDLLILGQITKQLANADPDTLLAVLRFLHGRAVALEAQAELHEMEERSLERGLQHQDDEEPED